MLASSRCRAWKAVRISQHTEPSALLPDFLVPSLARSFSTTRPQCSRIGQAPLPLPDSVQITVSEPSVVKGAVRRAAPPRTIHIQGPLGKLSLSMPQYMTLIQDPETKKAHLAIEDRSQRQQREMWGTTRAYLNNYIMGVSEGHSTILRLNGVGYRAVVQPKPERKTPEYEGQEFVTLKLGYSHLIELGVPRGIKATTPQPTRILLEGIDKEVINQFAAEIREWRRPEPYKGKGIFVNGETIVLKAKKIK